jgi:ABC-type nitrate/sulfonate/bicarbonate transport system substrate-binding protein
MTSRTTIRVALDWTPNTIHSGLFIAAAKGLYKDAGIDVELLSPGEDYRQTPAKRLENDEVDLAICPSESVIAYAESGKMKLQAIYAILQRDASAIVTTKLTRVSELGDNKIYGSYNARYEDRIVQAMVAKAGGNPGSMAIERQTGKHSLFDAVKKGDIDATWVFMPWEGLEAVLEGTEMQAFRMEDFGIPYGYSPVIARNVGTSRPSDEAMRKFVEATREGYEIALKEPKPTAAVASLMSHCVPQRSEHFLSLSQQKINYYYSDGSALGVMKHERWKSWIDWLEKEGMMQAPDLDPTDLYTNEFLE